MKKYLKILLLLTILQSCKTIEFKNGTYRYKYSYNGFYNTIVNINEDKSFTYETGGDRIIWRGAGKFRIINKKYAELVFLKPIVRSTILQEQTPILEKRDNLVYQIKQNNNYIEIQDTIEGPIALAIKNRKFYFVDKNGELIKRWKIANKPNKLRFVSRKRNSLILID